MHDNADNADILNDTNTCQKFCLLVWGWDEGYTVTYSRGSCVPELLPQFGRISSQQPSQNFTIVCSLKVKVSCILLNYDYFLWKWKWKSVTFFCSVRSKQIIIFSLWKKRWKYLAFSRGVNRKQIIIFSNTFIQNFTRRFPQIWFRNLDKCILKIIIFPWPSFRTFPFSSQFSRRFPQI